ncbi:hypothetical protein KKF81_05455 [Candidatus Micrarchaeota archaeon]|nr:hypothetical protein [Candidatus Micrarchaeota archaeon]MBU1166374.1 hypothetical protein [Candidatus Micrarchaeota archaeon]MBU1886898.1 hypothetical protein [Candidatus Micrarchaeota archaeon]
MNENQLVLCKQKRKKGLERVRSAFRRASLAVEVSGLKAVGLLSKETDIEKARRYKRIAEKIYERHMAFGIFHYYKRFQDRNDSQLQHAIKMATESYSSALGIDMRTFWSALKPYEQELKINSPFKKEITLQLLLEMAACYRMSPYYHTGSTSIGLPKMIYQVALRLAETPSKQTEIRQDICTYYSNLANTFFSVIMDSTNPKEDGLISFFGPTANLYTVAAFFETSPATASDLYIRAFECELVTADPHQLMHAFRNAMTYLFDTPLEADIRRRALSVMLEVGQRKAGVGRQFAVYLTRREPATAETSEIDCLRDECATIYEYAFEICGDGPLSYKGQELI